MTDEEKLKLMELFRKDVEPLERMEMPSFKRDPMTFKYQHHTFLFSVWLAGRSSAASQ